MDEVTKYERMLEVVKKLKVRYAMEEARLIRLLKQAKMRGGGHGTGSKSRVAGRY